MNLVCLGEIVAAHGIKGHVKIKTYTAKAQNIADYGVLMDKTGTKSFALKNVRALSAHSVVAYLDNINSRNAAEELIGTALYIDRLILPALMEDEYYHEDLIGLHVVDTDNNPCGVVIGLQDFGAGVFLDIKSDAHTKIATLPFNKDAIVRVDFDNKKIIADAQFLLV